MFRKIIRYIMVKLLLKNQIEIMGYTINNSYICLIFKSLKIVNVRK